jgi:tetratricopeptide (TPR) repeat protein
MDITQSKKEKTEESKTTQHYEILKELGDCFTALGNYDSAQSCFEKAAPLAPDEAAPYIGLGVIAAQKAQLEDAEIAFKVAARLDNKSSKAYAGLAMVAQQKNDYKHAFDMYLKSLELDPDNLTALLGLFQTSCQMGSFEKVIYYLEVYLDMHPADTHVMFTLAALYMKDNRPEKSKQLLVNILSLDADHKDAANLLEEVERSIVQKSQKQ